MEIRFLRVSLLLFLVLRLPVGVIGQKLTLLKEITAGPNGSNPKFFGQTGFFVSYPGGSSQRLFYTNATPEGTIQLHQDQVTIFPNSYGVPATVNPNTLLFGGKEGLYKTDGTAAGTTVIKDKLQFSFGYGTTLQNQLFFVASDSVDSRGFGVYSLWRSDATPNGTTKIRTVPTGIEQLMTVGNLIFFVGFDAATGAELWRTDGTAAGTKLVKDIRPGAAGSLNRLALLTAFGNKVLFSANDDGNGVRLWQSDGTTEGTTLVSSDTRSLSLSPIGVCPKDGVVYLKQGGGTDYTIWRTDGTAAGTYKLDTGPKNPLIGTSYLLTDEGFFVNYTDNQTGKGKIQKYLGNQVTTVYDLPEKSFYATLLGFVNGTIYFQLTSSNRTWRSDGTAGGTYTILNKTSGNEFSRAYDLFVINNRTYLAESQFGTGILFTRIDQSAGKEVRSEVLNTTNDAAFSLGSSVVVNGKLVGSAYSDGNRSNFEPWAFDPGTPPAQSCFLTASVSGNLSLPCITNGTTSLTANAKEATAPLTYQWQRNSAAISGATSATYAAGSTGDYTVLITDSKSCSAASPAQTVVAAKPMSVTLTGSDTACKIFFSSSVSGSWLRANVTDGTAPFSYRWALASTPLSTTTAEQKVYSGGVYSLTVTDACTSSVQSKTITEAESPVVTVSGGTAGCTGQPVALTALATGGKLPYTYEWRTSNAQAITTPVLPATANNGTYGVTVTSADGCPGFATVEKGGIPKPIAISLTGPATLCSGRFSTLNVSLTNGTAPYTYQWKLNGNIVSTNAVSLSITTGGMYSLSVTDACSSTTASFSVTESPSPTVSVGGALAVCTGQPATLTAIASGGTAPYSYQWRQGNAVVGGNAPSLTATGGNSYALTVTDAKGCAATSAAVSVSAAACAMPTVSLPPGGVSATSPQTLSASTGLTGGTNAGATYQWLLNGNPIAGATNSTYTASVSGSYAVAITINGQTTNSPAIALTINVVLATEPTAALSESQVTVYPNPTTGECWVTVDVATRQTVSMHLTDALGRPVRQWNMQAVPRMAPVRITLPDAGGIYFLRMETEKGSVVKKVMRVR